MGSQKATPVLHSGLYPTFKKSSLKHTTTQTYKVSYQLLSTATSLSHRNVADTELTSNFLHRSVSSFCLLMSSKFHSLGVVQC